MRPGIYEDEVHTNLRLQARRFAEREILPNASRWDEAEAFPRDLYRVMAESGLLGVGYSSLHGGADGDLTHLLAVNEELTFRGRSVAVVAGLGSHAIVLPLIIDWGTPELIERFVRPTLKGEMIASLAITEPESGSDVANVRTTGTVKGDRLVINGAKTFITSGCRADFVLAAVRTGGPGYGGLSLVVIPSNLAGFSASKPMGKLGWKSSDTAELSFDNCEVPLGNVVGELNQGFVPIVSNFSHERLFLASQCLALGELSLSLASSYASNRSAFGKPLLGFQVTRHKLADMATKVFAIRCMLDSVVTRNASKEDVKSLVAMTKNAASDMALSVANDALQIHGGSGFMRGSDIERVFRDARLYAIGGGTREIMNEIIAKFEGFRT